MGNINVNKQYMYLLKNNWRRHKITFLVPIKKGQSSTGPEDNARKPYCFYVDPVGFGVGVHVASFRALSSEPVDGF